MHDAATIGSILWDAARRSPRRAAVVGAGPAWTFGELASRSRRLMGLLDGLGVRRGQPVALLLENSPEFIAAHYALAAMGAVIVPLNHHLRGPSLRDAVEMCEASCLVSSPVLWDALRSGPGGARVPGACLLLEAGPGADDPPAVRTVARGLDGGVSPSRPLDDTPEAAVPPGPGADDHAVLFLTSGTTGTPKGIRVTHRQALLGIDLWTRRWSFGPDTVSMMVAPYFHVVYNPLVLGAHRQGGTAAIPANLQARVAAGEAERSRATAIMGTPFFFMQFLNDRRQRARDLGAIDTVIYGAAPTPVPVIRALQERFPGARLFNCYGLTETCSAVSCLASDELPGREDSVGRAHPGVEVEIRGEDHRELMAGEVGEVYCRGANVITGYYKAPEADATRFHAGWLRTGDMGRLDADGYLYLLGRCDDLINVGGEKAYPGEVEAVLHRHPDVLDAAVAVVPDPAKGQAVKAFVVPRSEGGLDVGDLKKFCIRYLPPAFVPRVFDLVEFLPRNASGKILRRQLALPIVT